eukprot:TRINITY_DN9478_c0_g1_i2.p1 TRINITY_DN9478_c0_g1~~TRINITY_DN9478_c0_g1_i2.p1  ORF type:complete len:509 (+),score=152.65 TRINITY_DN9478_c0_g1_i2:60-1586(+)
MKLLAALTLGVLAFSAATTLDQLTQPIKLSVSEWEALEATPHPVVLYFTDTPDETADVDAAAASLGALGRLAIVDSSNEKLLEALDVDKASLPQWRALTYNDDGRTSQDFENADDAVQFAKDSIPELVELVEDPAQLQNFLIKSIQKQKLAAFLYTKKAGVPEVATKLALWMQETYQLHVVTNPPPEMLQPLGGKLPAMTVFFPAPSEEVEQEQIAFQQAAFDRKKHGGFKFENMVQFLALLRGELEQKGVLKNFFDMTGGERGQQQQRDARSSSNAATKIAPLFEVTAETPDYCSDTKLGLCLIALLDGASPDLAAHKQMLEEVQATSQSKGRVVHFMWVDATCHPSMATGLDVQVDLLPAIVAVSPKKGKMAVMRGRFEASGIDEFLAQVLAGRLPLAPINAMPQVDKEEDCDAIHQAALEPVVEEDFDLADIMAEDVGDEAAASEVEAEEEAQSARASLNAQDQAEMDAKIAKAMKEMEKLNAKSKKKKRRRRRRRRRRAAKDEL